MLKMLKKYTVFGIIAALCMIGEVSADLIQPGLMSKIVDEGVLNVNGVSDNMSIIFSYGIKMIIVVFFGGLSGVLCGLFANIFSQKWGNDIRKEAFKKVMLLSFDQTDKFSVGSLVTRITNDVTQLQMMAMQMVRGMIRSGMFFFGGIYCVRRLDSKMGITVMVALPIVAIFILMFILKAVPFFELLQKKLDRVNSIMQENVSGARVVKAYVKEEYEKKRFSFANNELVDTQFKVMKLFVTVIPVVNIILNIVVVIIIKLGSVDVSTGQTTPGNVVAVITYVTLIIHSVLMLAMIFQLISRGRASYSRLKEIIDTVPTINDGDYDKDTDAKGEIEFKNVYFSYGKGENVLSDISFKVNSGQTIGILGSTGSGKTSLINLITRFYDCTQGEILVDGINVKKYKLKTLRSKISVALQKSELFYGTIEDNIKYGNTTATREQVISAAICAQADEFIKNNPKGYDAIVSEGGTSLSGGQKQRIAIARALLKNAEIIIFDDSTSALDLKTERKLYNALNEKYAKTTKIIIAQRISSVMNADNIIVLDKGKAVAIGNHEYLLKNNDIYKDIYDSQLKGGDDNNG